jgi:hypothetical protein
MAKGAFMTLIENSKEWKWYKKQLDVEQKYEHRHNGEPERFPCKVKSDWWDDPNGPYTYDHTFIYQRDVKCKKCGHVSKEWDV